MKRALVTAVVLAAVVCQAQSTTPQAPAEEPKLAAIVNGEKITVDDVNRMYSLLPPSVRTNYDAGGGKAQFLDTYIRKRLLAQEATKINFEKSPEIAAALRDARESTLVDLYVRRVVSADVITDAEMRKYYDEHTSDYKVLERVKARHIIATLAPDPVQNTSKDNAKSDEEALRKMKNLIDIYHLSPANFADMAIRFSEDGAALQGGELGWFNRGKMVPEFEEAAFNTPVGQVSPLVKTVFGYHYILVEGHEAERMKPYDEVKNEIREKFLTERADKVLAEVNSLTMQLQGASRIQTFKSNLEH